MCSNTKPDSAMSVRPQIIYKECKTNLLDRSNELMYDITKN